MCGIVAVRNVRKAIELAVVGAHELQHRARTYAGAVSSDGQNFYRHAGKNLARNVFSPGWLNRLHGTDALVHLRYPTVGDKEDRDNTQPIQGIYAGKPLAIGHNGNLTNTAELARILPASLKMATALDTEYILRLIEHFQTGDIEADLKKVLPLLKGSFSLVILMPDRLIAVRDRRGNRPLSIGTLEGGYCIASEKCAFPIMRARHLQDVAAGTMAIIGEEGGIHISQFAQADERKCVFELLYNSSVASKVFDVGVTRFRIGIGEELEKLFPVQNGMDLIVTPVPDSGKPYAQGYAKSGRSGQDFQVIWRNHYVGRTFNAASQALRDEDIARKFMFDADEIAGKRIVVLDDSIVRGSTLPKIVEMLWWLGAKEVHLRIAMPPIAHLCRYGIYMEEDGTELVAAKFTPVETCREFNATSLEYLPLETLKKILPDSEHYCTACMDGSFWD